MSGLEILILRHGKTALNLRGRYQGRTDVPLCPEGEAELLGMGVCPDVRKVYISPMRRAVRTAEICFPNAEQVPVPDFREMDFGAFEEKNYEEMADDPDYRSWVDGLCRGKCPGGESMGEFVERVCAAFDRMTAEAIGNGEKRLVIAAHGGTVMALLSRYGRPEKDYYDWYAPNGGGYTMLLDEAAWVSEKTLTDIRPFSALSELRGGDPA